MKNNYLNKTVSSVMALLDLINSRITLNAQSRVKMAMVRVTSLMLVAFSVFQTQVYGQCCAAGTSGMTQYSTTILSSSVLSQTGGGTAWTNTGGALTAGDGSQAQNTGIGLDALGLLTANTQTLNISIPAYAIPAGQRFCSATINYSISSTISSYPITVFVPFVGNVTVTIPALNLGSYVTVTTTPATVTQANITSGFTASISAAYGFTGTGLMSISLDAVTVTVVTQSGCPLPVSLKDFTGEQEGRCAKLNWSTYSEQNNDHFTIQKLIENKFVDIAEIASESGTTLIESNYEFTDCDVSPINYYRLTQTDKNGETDVIGELVSVAIDMDDPGQLSVVPNPAENFACIYSDENLQFMRVISLEGKVVREEKLSGDERKHCFDVEDVPAGVYTVQVETTKGIATKKLVVR